MDLPDPAARELDPERSYPKRRVLFEKTEILFLLATLLGCVVTFVRAALAAPLPYQLDFAEGPLLGGSIRVAQGLGAYPPATQLPYVLSSYGPLPYYLGGLCVKLFGVSFTAPRLLVVASGIWCAVIIALLRAPLGRHVADQPGDSVSSTCHGRSFSSGYPSFA